MKQITFFLIVFLAFDSQAQYSNYQNCDFHYKAVVSLAAGPETGIAFPPKVSFYAFVPRQRHIYAGVDLSLGTLGYSKSAGATVGFQYKALIIDNSFGWTSVYQEHAANKMWLSLNPKIGFEIQSFTMKAGPSFVLREYNGHHILQDLVRINNQRFNIEIGFIIDSN